MHDILQLYVLWTGPDSWVHYSILYENNTVVHAWHCVHTPNLRLKFVARLILFFIIEKINSETTTDSPAKLPALVWSSLRLLSPTETFPSSRDTKIDKGVISHNGHVTDQEAKGNGDLTTSLNADANSRKRVLEESLSHMEYRELMIASL